ncbi:hypothetical protein Tco_1209103, partial [Tanacetum coccineum]
VDEIEFLLHRDPSTPKLSIASILEGFTNESPFEENDDLFDLESKENEWKKILYDAPIDDLMTEDKDCPDYEDSRARGMDISIKGQNQSQIGQNRAREWKERKKPKLKATLAIQGYPIGGRDMHTIQGSKIDGNEAVGIKGQDHSLGEHSSSLSQKKHTQAPWLLYK